MFSKTKGRTPRQNYIKVYKGEDDLWYWHLKAKNGRIIADSSEGYLTKQHAVRAAEGFREAATNATISYDASVTNGR